MAHELETNLKYFPDHPKKVKILGQRISHAVSARWREFCRPRFAKMNEKDMTTRQQWTALGNAYHDWLLGVGSYSHNNPYEDIADVLRSVRRTFRI